MKYLLTLLVLISTPSLATDKEVIPRQVQWQGQEQSIWLQNQLEQFNNQANAQTLIQAPSCVSMMGNVTVKDVSVPLPSLSGALYKQEYGGWGGSICGTMAIGTKRYQDYLNAQMIKEKTLEDAVRLLADTVQKLEQANKDQNREINRLNEERNSK